MIKNTSGKVDWDIYQAFYYLNVQVSYLKGTEKSDYLQPCVTPAKPYWRTIKDEIYVLEFRLWWAGYHVTAGEYPII